MTATALLEAWAKAFKEPLRNYLAKIDVFLEKNERFSAAFKRPLAAFSAADYNKFQRVTLAKHELDIARARYRQALSGLKLAIEAIRAELARVCDDDPPTELHLESPSSQTRQRQRA
jgi:hypothetical protein